MKHIDIYIFYKYGQKIFPYLDDFHLTNQIRINMNIHTNTDIKLRLKEWHRKAPKTKYVVHALSDLGLSPKTIADFLDITTASVSYHLQKTPEKEYVNPEIVSYFKWLDDLEKERNNTYSF